MYSLSKLPVEIPKSKTRPVLLFLASVTLVLSGIFLFIYPGGEVPYFLGSKLSIRITASLCILFFGMKTVYLFFKIIDTKPGLIISETGITDHSSKADAGLIVWKDIKSIREITVFKNRILLVFLNNPDDYITKQTERVSKKTMEMNYQLYGSPVGLSANGLKINFTSLKIIIDECFRKFSMK